MPPPPSAAAAAQAQTTIASQLLSHLSQKHLHPTQPWLANFLTTQKPTTPLPALKQTALFRLLASDIRSSLISSPQQGQDGSTPPTFPTDILDAKIKERKLPRNVVCMVLDVEDVTRSRWSAVERIEEQERGETTKGREVIRVVDGEAGLGATVGAETGGGMCKLLLCDAAGVQVYGFEMESVQGIEMDMSIGAKVLLKEGTLVVRGVVLLEGKGCVLLGGKLEELVKKWKEGRKARLTEQIQELESE